MFTFCSKKSSCSWALDHETSCKNPVRCARNTNQGGGFPFSQPKVKERSFSTLCCSHFVQRSHLKHSIMPVQRATKLRPFLPAANLNVVRVRDVRNTSQKGESRSSQSVQIGPTWSWKLEIWLSTLCSHFGSKKSWFARPWVTVRAITLCSMIGQLYLMISDSIYLNFRRHISSLYLSTSSSLLATPKRDWYQQLRLLGDINSLNKVLKKGYSSHLGPSRRTELFDTLPQLECFSHKIISVIAHWTRQLSEAYELTWILSSVCSKASNRQGWTQCLHLMWRASEA